jgi:hypothetical protein
MRDPFEDIKYKEFHSCCECVDWEAITAGDVEWLKDEVVRLRSKPSADDVLFIRCIKHQAVPQYNKEKGSTAECVECEVERLRCERGCLMAGPGRGDCLHFVGLPAEENEQTTDSYGRPNGWCEVCWSHLQNERLRKKADQYEQDWVAAKHEFGVKIKEYEKRAWPACRWLSLGSDCTCHLCEKERQLRRVVAERDALLSDLGRPVSGQHPVRHKGYYELKYEAALDEIFALKQRLDEWMGRNQ